jgi:HEAT repeat protein
VRLNRVVLLGIAVFVIPAPGRATEDGAAVQELIKKLETGDRLARQDAAESLGRLGPAAVKAVPALTKAMQRESTRPLAARALAAIGPEGWEPLLHALRGGGNGDANRTAAWIALDNHGPRTLRFLVRDLRPQDSLFYDLFDGDRPLKNRLVAELTGTASPPLAALPFLLRTLKDDDWEVRAVSASALGRMGPLARPAIPTLLDALEDPWPLESVRYAFAGLSVRERAADALLAIGPAAEDRLVNEGVPRLIDGLFRGDHASRRHALRALTTLGPKAKAAVPVLAAQLKVKPTEPNALFEHVPEMDVLTAIGADSVPTLVAILDDHRGYVRRRVLSVLAEMGGSARSALPGVRRCLSDPVAEVRLQVARALDLLEPDRVVAARSLTKLLADTHSEVRMEAASALGKRGPEAKEAIAALNELLQDKEPLVAAKAASSLIMLGAPEDMPLKRLTELIGTRDWRNGDCGDVGLNELMTLGRRARGAIPAVVAHLDAKDPEGVTEIAGVVVRIAPEKAGPIVPHLVNIVRNEKLADLHRQWSRSCDYQVRSWALGYLKDLGPRAREAVPALLELLTRRNPKGPAPKEVGAVLAAIGPAAREAIPVLRRCIENDDEVSWAAPALFAIDPDDPAVLPALMALLQFQDPYGDWGWEPPNYPRRCAIEALGRLGPRARAAVPRLEKILQEQDDRFNAWLTQSYWRDASVLMTVAAALLQITSDEERFVPILLRGVRVAPDNLVVLGDLAAGRPWAMALLMKSLNSSDPDICAAAAAGLGRCGPAAKEAVPDLIRAIQRNGTKHSQRQWIQVLGLIDPAALEANPQLLEIPRPQDSR